VFVNSTHLPQRLRAEDYTSEEVHQRELTDLFLPCWHFVGTLAEIPHVGDFCTREILGRSLIIWHTAEGIRVYLNVCAHRFCQLTNQPAGRAVKMIKCQYHGWEYDSTGNTCRIPDAQSFRPLAKGELGLPGVRGLSYPDRPARRQSAKDQPVRRVMSRAPIA
jgi:phenylpropionate dioxygenase-like ring-hydroxylating dioxygenase large terminal subunit